MFYQCNNHGDYELREVDQVKFISSRGGSSSAVTPFFVNVNGQNYDLSKTGSYHNYILSYVKDNGHGFSYVNDSLLMQFTTSKVTQGLSSIISLDTLVTPSFFTPIYSSSFHHSIFARGLGEASIDSLNKYFKTHVDELYNKGALNSAEKSLLNDYIDEVSEGTSVDYEDYKDQWDNISSKPYNGAYSALLLVIGSYSSDWWHAFHDDTYPDEDEIYFVGHIMADLCGGAYGTANYMYNNWGDHYMSEFGLNSLSAGGSTAMGWSAASLTRYLF